MAQDINQFTIGNEKGLLIKAPEFNVFSAQVTTGETALIPGQAVKITTTGGSALLVESLDAITDAVFGFVTYDVGQDSFPALGMVKIATDNCVMMMQAGAAINAGATLMIQVSGTKVVTQTSTNTKIGVALENASGDGALIRVLIKSPQV